MKISPLQIRLTKSRDNTTGTAIFKFNIDNVMYSSWLKTNQMVGRGGPAGRGQ